MASDAIERLFLGNDEQKRTLWEQNLELRKKLSCWERDYEIISQHYLELEKRHAAMIEEMAWKPTGIAVVEENAQIHSDFLRRTIENLRDSISMRDGMLKFQQEELNELRGWGKVTLFGLLKKWWKIRKEEQWPS